MLRPIKIGREDKGKENITVPQECKMVGRHHATLWVDDENGTLTIEEIDAKNGTFVNGRRIAKSGQLKVGDRVWLGEEGPLGYQVDVDKLLTDIRTDYSEEFEKVIEAYDEYYAEIKQLEESKRKKTVMPRAIISFIFAVAALLICLFSKGPDAMSTRITVMTVGTAIVAALNLIPFGKSEDTRMQMTDISLRYQDRYCCPKCGAKFNLNSHWKIVQKNHCPKFKCILFIVKFSF